MKLDRTESGNGRTREEPCNLVSPQSNERNALVPATLESRPKIMNVYCIQASVTDELYCSSNQNTLGDLILSLPATHMNKVCNILQIPIFNQPFHTLVKQLPQEAHTTQFAISCGIPALSMNYRARRSSNQKQFSSQIPGLPQAHTQFATSCRLPLSVNQPFRMLVQ